MNALKDALLRVVEVCDRERELDAAMRLSGYTNNPHGDNWGALAEAITYLIGEKPFTFTDSVTYKVLTSQLAAGVKARMLMDEYQKTVKGVCKQPAPTLASREEVREMFHKHGGYVVEEADRPE